MNEQTAWAQLAHVAATVAAVAWADPAWMCLERVPQTQLTATEAQGAIRLARLVPTEPFDQWERGRVFDAVQELKWEWRTDAFHAVYCGNAPPHGFTPFPVAADTARTQRYYVWGQHVSAADRACLGLDPHAPLFIELRIQRILHYPVSADTQRVQIETRAWLGTDGTLAYLRWCALREERN